jgi:ABC-2 type transport system ATP-binding protein
MSTTPANDDTFHVEAEIRFGRGILAGGLGVRRHVSVDQRQVRAAVWTNGRCSVVGRIELREVTRRFGQLTAVNEVSISVEPGEIVGLLGHNGAGKTTLLRVINGLLRPDGGRLTVDGLDPTVDGDEVRRKVGVLTEYPALDEYLSTRENLEVYAAIHGVPEASAAARIDRLLAELGLDDRRDVEARELSAGLKQRVALARALVHDPQFLLLDEPTTNMDPVAARIVRHMVHDAARNLGKTVLLSTHNLVEAEDLCDRIGIMRQGRLLDLGTPTSLRLRLGGVRGVRVVSDEPGVELMLARFRTDGSSASNGLRARRVDDSTIEFVAASEVPDIVATLVGAGVAIHAVLPIQPSLEDLYIALHQTGAAG